MTEDPLPSRRPAGSRTGAGRWPPRGRMTAIALVGVGAVVLSTVTVLGLRWATAPHAAAAPRAERLGFVRLDRSAPSLSLPALSGSAKVSVSGLAGRPIVMNFWSSTCDVCKSETPALASVARELRGKVTFVGIDSADSRGPASAFVARYRVPYPIAFDPQAAAASRFGVIALPVTFFLSPSGRTILGENIGALTAARLRAILRRLYGVR